MSGEQEAQGVSVTYRNGCNDDAPYLVRLLNSATQGASFRVWKIAMTGSENDPFETGARIICETGHPWAPERAVIAEASGEIAGAAYAYPLLRPETEPDFSTRPLEDAPYFRLQSKAGNAIYIENISVFPEFQGKGIGGGLLNFIVEAGQQLSRNSSVNFDCAALIVNDDNSTARSFYENHGFSYLAFEDVPPGTYYPEGKRVHLMVRPFGGPGVS